MTKLIIGMGIPGSGKSTTLKKFAEDYGYNYICPDDIREEMLGDAADQSKNQEVWDEARKKMQEFFKRGKTVVFDAVFNNAKRRKEFIDYAKATGVEIKRWEAGIEKKFM